MRRLSGPSERRDDWLRATDDALLKACREERYRASGPGGQRRNKVETAVRLSHIDTGLVAQAEESRSLMENRARAVRRLRERIALTVRAPFDLLDPHVPPDFVAYRSTRGALAVSRRNPAYPIIAATVLDALAAAGGSYATAGRALELTTSQVLQFLKSDRELWRAAEGHRSR